jgi:hypothetical protein
LQDAFGNPLGTSYTGDAIGDCLGDPSGAAAMGTTCGDGTLTPNAHGTLLVQNLAPGKYGVLITPPTGSDRAQTSTIEGTPVNDAWVKANEPPYFVEFGPPGPHVFFGFTRIHEADAVARHLADDGLLSRPVTQVFRPEDPRSAAAAARFRRQVAILTPWPLGAKHARGSGPRGSTPIPAFPLPGGR